MKCWKKSQTGSGYYKKISDKSFEKINFKFKKEFKGKPWVAVIENPPRRIVYETEYFKTKHRAIKFANKYMKEHDKC